MCFKEIYLVKNLYNKDFQKIKKVSGQYAFGILVFSCLIMLAAPEIILILGTQEYRDAIYVVIPIVLGGFYSFLYTLPVQVEYYYEKTGFIALCSCGAAILNIILNGIFIPRYGYIAAAYTTLVTYLCYFILHYLIAIKLSKGKLFNNMTIIGIIILSVLCGIVALVLIHKMIVRWIAIIIISVCYGGWLEKKYNFLAIIKSKFRK